MSFNRVFLLAQSLERVRNGFVSWIQWLKHMSSRCIPLSFFRSLFCCFLLQMPISRRYLAAPGSLPTNSAMSVEKLCSSANSLPQSPRNLILVTFPILVTGTPGSLAHIWSWWWALLHQNHPRFFQRKRKCFVLFCFFSLSRNRWLNTGQANENLSSTYQEVSWQSVEESNGSAAPPRYLYPLGAPRERTRSYVPR